MGPITPERWQILSARLDEYFELEPAQRDGWIAALKQSDAALAADLSFFISVQDSAGFSQFLGSPAVTVDEKLTALVEERSTLDAELVRLRAEVAAAKQANAAHPDTHDYSEAETRDFFIDLLLASGRHVRGDATVRDI